MTPKQYILSSPLTISNSNGAGTWRVPHGLTRARSGRACSNAMFDNERTRRQMDLFHLCRPSIMQCPGLRLAAADSKPLLGSRRQLICADPHRSILFSGHVSNHVTCYGSIKNASLCDEEEWTFLHISILLFDNVVKFHRRCRHRRHQHRHYC